MTRAGDGSAPGSACKQLCSTELQGKWWVAMATSPHTFFTTSIHTEHDEYEEHLPRVLELLLIPSDLAMRHLTLALSLRSPIARPRVCRCSWLNRLGYRHCDSHLLPQCSHAPAPHRIAKRRANGRLGEATYALPTGVGLCPSVCQPCGLTGRTVVYNTYDIIHTGHYSSIRAREGRPGTGPRLSALRQSVQCYVCCECPVAGYALLGIMQQSIIRRLVNEYRITCNTDFKARRVETMKMDRYSWLQSMNGNEVGVAITIGR